MTSEQVTAMIAQACDYDPDLTVIRFDGLDEAVMGWCCRKGMAQPVLLYDRAKCVAALAVQFDADEDASAEEMAIEFLEFNTFDAYLGEGTPAFFVGPEEP